jgi:hypothetical protein
MPAKTKNHAGGTAWLGNPHLADDAPRNSASGHSTQHQCRRKRPSSYSIIEVYDGLKRLGVVERLRRGGFRALTVDGRALSRFATDREAAQALLRLMAQAVPS